MFKTTHRFTREMIGNVPNHRVIAVGTEVMVDTEYSRPCSDCVNVRFEAGGELYAVPENALQPIPKVVWP